MLTNHEKQSIISAYRMEVFIQKMTMNERSTKLGLTSRLPMHYNVLKVFLPIMSSTNW